MFHKTRGLLWDGGGAHLENARCNFVGRFLSENPSESPRNKEVRIPKRVHPVCEVGFQFGGLNRSPGRLLGSEKHSIVTW